MKPLNERWNIKLFKSGERLKSCRVKLPFKGNSTSWKNLMKLNKGKSRVLRLGRSIPTHLFSLVADEVESHWVVWRGWNVHWDFDWARPWANLIQFQSGIWLQGWSCFESGARSDISRTSFWKNMFCVSISAQFLSAWYLKELQQCSKFESAWSHTFSLFYPPEKKKKVIYSV